MIAYTSRHDEYDGELACCSFLGAIDIVAKIGSRRIQQVIFWSGSGSCRRRGVELLPRTSAGCLPYGLSRNIDSGIAAAGTELDTYRLSLRYQPGQDCTLTQ